jgi:uncharacterized protein YeaC (DUF1315 family)
MNYKDAVEGLTPQLIEKMKLAIEIGRWENGDKLTPEQLESAIQAVMLWQATHQEPGNDEPFTLDAEGNVVLGKPTIRKASAKEQERLDDPNLITKSRL